MAIEMKTTLDHLHTTSLSAPEGRIHNAALKVGRFLLHLLEMLLAMAAGMVIFSLLSDLIPASSRYSAAFNSGTYLSDLAMGVFMTVPMVAWMIVRGHGWHHGAEMGLAMFAPVIAICMLRLLFAGDDLSWLDHASHLGPLLGMLAAILYRHDHYTGKAGRLAHATH